MEEDRGVPAPVTLHLLDVASYQGDLRPADVVRAGFDAVNLKISHSTGGKSVHPRVGWWVAEARRLGLGISTFHYFTDDAPGLVQAEACLEQMTALGLLTGTAHQVDVESAPAPALVEVRAYIRRVTAALRRSVVVYTGDWWWTARPGWNVSDLTPHVWAAPNVGYLGFYPGDESTHWRAGYGGWPNLSIMQYAVGPLTYPDGAVGTIRVSKSAIRDPAVWQALTTERPTMTFAPDSIKAVRNLYMNALKLAGFTINPLAVGIVRNEPGTSYHIGEDYLNSGAYSVVESSRDRNGLSNASSAIDLGWFSFTRGGKTHNLRTFSAWLVAQCRAGTADSLDIREVIYSLDGQSVKRWDRLGIRSTGDSSHETHTHVSWFRDSENRNKVALFERYFREIGILEDPDMPLTNADADLVINRLLAREIETANASFGSLNGLLATIASRTGSTNNVQLPALATAVASVLANVQADDADKAALLAAIAASQDATVQGVVEALSSPELTDAQVAAALAAVLGERAVAVGTILAAGTPPTE